MSIKKPAIAVIGANEFQNRLILKAKELGYETHAFAWRENAEGEKTADRFYAISIDEKEKILEACRRIRPAAVLSIASDLAVPTVAYVARHLGLISNSEASALVSTNKYEMRLRFQRSGIATPRFIGVSSYEECADAKFAYPVIVKPTDRSGSRGVTRVDGAQQLKSAVENCIAVSFEKKAIVEEFIEGEEFSAEYISHRGRHTLLAVTRKYTTGAPHYIETGHLQPAQLSGYETALACGEIEKGLDALEIQNGASHAEFKITRDGSVRLIEIGARMGGDFIGSDLVFLSTGRDYLKMVLDVACGKAPDLRAYRAPQSAAVRFILNETDLAKLKEIKRQCPEILYRTGGTREVSAHAVTDSSSRFGYYLAASPDRERLQRVFCDEKAEIQ